MQKENKNTYVSGQVGQFGKHASRVQRPLATFSAFYGSALEINQIFRRKS
jgi:hypothetical protein